MIPIEDMIKAAVEMTGPDFLRFTRVVAAQRKAKWEALREAEADRLTQAMDMTPEGYVREWDRRGRQDHLHLPAWEWTYQRAGDVAEALVLVIGIPSATILSRVLRHFALRGYRRELMERISAARVSPPPSKEP